MNKLISQLHIYNLGNVHFGILPEIPTIIQLSEEYYNVLNNPDISNNDQSFEGIEKSLSDVLNLSKSKITSQIKYNKDDITSLLIELPEEAGKARNLVREIRNIYGRCSENLNLTLAVRKKYDYRIVDQFCAELKKNNNNKKNIKIVLQLPLKEINENILRHIKKHSIKIQLLTGEDLERTLKDKKIREDLIKITNSVSPSLIITSEELDDNSLKFLIGLGIKLSFHYCNTGCSNTLTKNFNYKPVIEKEILVHSSLENIKYLDCLINNKINTEYCGAGKWYLAISSEGEIYPCDWFMKKKENKLGLLNEYYYRNTGDPEYLTAAKNNDHCSSCWAKNICGGGCLTEAFNRKQNNSINNDYCIITKEKIEKSGYLLLRKDESSKILLRKYIEHYKEHFHFYSNTPQQNKCVEMKTLGYSMSPLIKPEAKLKVEFCEYKDFHVGDIISYVSEGKIITHRLMFKINMNNNLYFIEKGDNAFFKEIARYNIIGKVVEIKNTDMDDYVSVETLLFRIGGIAIVFIAITFWFIYFSLTYGYKIVKAIFGSGFNLFKAVNKILKEKPLNPGEYIIRISNMSNRVIINNILFIELIRKSHGKSILRKRASSI